LTSINVLNADSSVALRHLSMLYLR